MAPAGGRAANAPGGGPGGFKSPATAMATQGGMAGAGRGAPPNAKVSYCKKGNEVCLFKSNVFLSKPNVEYI